MSLVKKTPEMFRENVGGKGKAWDWAHKPYSQGSLIHFLAGLGGPDLDHSWLLGVAPVSSWTNPSSPTGLAGF